LELVWRAQGEGGQPVVRDTDPDVSSWRRFTAWVIALLPIEKEL
jgi:hypothetical protein